MQPQGSRKALLGFAFQTCHSSKQPACQFDFCMCIQEKKIQESAPFRSEISSFRCICLMRHHRPLIEGERTTKLKLKRNGFFSANAQEACGVHEMG